jgi:hypothetical protein
MSSWNPISGDVRLVTETGVFLVTGAGSYLVAVPASGAWGDISDTQTPNWGAVNDAQTNSWTTVPDTQTGTWAAVNDSQTSTWTNVTT